MAAHRNRAVEFTRVQHLEYAVIVAVQLQNLATIGQVVPLLVPEIIPVVILGGVALYGTPGSLIASEAHAVEQQHRVSLTLQLGNNELLVAAVDKATIHLSIVGSVVRVGIHIDHHLVIDGCGSHGLTLAEIAIRVVVAGKIIIIEIALQRGSIHQGDGTIITSKSAMGIIDFLIYVPQGIHMLHDHGTALQNRATGVTVIQSHHRGTRAGFVNHGFPCRIETAGVQFFRSSIANRAIKPFRCIEVIIGAVSLLSLAQLPGIPVLDVFLVVGINHHHEGRHFAIHLHSLIPFS